MPESNMDHANWQLPPGEGESELKGQESTLTAPFPWNQSHIALQNAVTENTVNQMKKYLWLTWPILITISEY